MRTKIILTTLALFAALAFSGIATAADGGDASALQAGPTKSLGAVHVLKYLCDAAVAADSTCDEFDWQANGGIPDAVDVTIHSANNCSADYSVDINQGAVSGSTEHDLLTLNATNTDGRIEGKGKFKRFWNVDLSNMTDCDITGGTGLTVLIEAKYEI